jgi:hypothetical protein
MWWIVMLCSFPSAAQVQTKDGVRQGDSGWVLREDGIGPVLVGMTLEQLNKVLGETFSMPQSKEEQACFYVEPSHHPQVGFMMMRGRVARIDVTRAGIFTSKHIEVGDSEARALQAYGSSLKVEPHAYSAPDGHYLTIRSGRYGLRFETYKGKIDMFYAGRSDAIQYIEGCQ